jgi:hypothetical protein
MEARVGQGGISTSREGEELRVVMGLAQLDACGTKGATYRGTTKELVVVRGWQNREHLRSF